jgi:hypothetical protein
VTLVSPRAAELDARSPYRYVREGLRAPRKSSRRHGHQALSGILALAVLTQGYLIISHTAPFFSQNFPFTMLPTGGAATG